MLGEFHQAFGHPICNCLALGPQFDELVKSRFLNDYLAKPERTETPTASGEDQGHEMPVHGRSTPSRGDSQVEGALLSAQEVCTIGDVSRDTSGE